MVLVALVPAFTGKVTCSLYGPVFGATVKVTGPLTPQLVSACNAPANDWKLVAEAGTFLLMVKLPVKVLQEKMLISVVSFCGRPSVNPFGSLVQALILWAPKGKEKLPMVTGVETALVAKPGDAVKAKSGCATLFTFQPIVAEASGLAP